MDKCLLMEYPIRIRESKVIQVKSKGKRSHCNVFNFYLLFFAGGGTHIGTYIDVVWMVIESVRV